MVVRRIINRARLGSVEELKSPAFIAFMEQLNAFSKPLGLHQYSDFSKNWEYPWLWINGLEDLVRPGVRILDIGSELSPMPWFFASKGAEVTLMEFHGELVGHWEWIRRELNVAVNWKISEAQGLPFPDGRFNIVTSLSVIEHQPNQAEVVDELGRVLEEGGVLGLSFDICEPERGMTYPDASGAALTLTRFEELIWNNTAFTECRLQLHLNLEDIEDFHTWHRKTAEHHNYIVGAAVMQKWTEL